MATIDPIDNGYGIVSIPTVTEIDPNGDVSSPLLVLSDRGGNKFGVIENPVDLTFSFELNAPFEISFYVDKFNNDEENSLWDKIETFRLIYVPHWNIWFEIDVQIDESNNLRKSVTGVRLQEAELSQTMIYGMEVNTENDIDREDYSPTVFYNPENTDASLLHRLLAKAPHYSIIHVDSSLASIQRTFEFDGTSILDAFNEVATEIGCLFVYGETTDANGTIARTVSAYDLLSYCPNCGYRGTFEDTCPKCGYEYIVEGYGNDTTIFVTADVLGDSITVNDDKDSVKNCFHLVGGDDLMTATIINCNPNGTQYLWRLPPSTRRHMSDDLQIRLKEYDDEYEYYQSRYAFFPSESAVSDYNALVTKYSRYKEDLEPMTESLIGYPEITEQYYNVLDFYGFLENTLMPSETPVDTSAAQQLANLTVANLSPLGVSNASTASQATVESAIKTYVKVYVDTSRYSVDIVGGSTYSNRTWNGAFKVTSLTDPTDTATGSSIRIVVTDTTDVFVKQKIDKMLAKETIEACDAVQLFDMSLANFKIAIKDHCLSNLELLRSAADSCLEIMISAGIASKNDLTLYAELYMPYYRKQQAVDNEIKIREEELADLETMLNEISNVRYVIMDTLNFEEYIKSADNGEALWVEFCSFRREDEYSNSNYISEGLTNSELIERAVEFLEVANEEIGKASELQYTVSSTLKNLLATHEFDPLPSYFRLGNWIRVGIDDDIYKLRLVGYTLNFDDISNFSVTFSDVTRGNGFMTDVQDILSRAKSMSTSYSYVQRQAMQGADADRRVKMIATVGLDLTNNKIISNADNQDVVYDKHGMLFREYDDVLDDYKDKQTKIINRGIYFTTDAWETAKAGLGDFYYYDPETGVEKEGYGVIADTIIGNIILSNEVGVYNETGTIKLTEDGIDIVADGTSGSNQMSFTISKTTSSGTTKTLYVDTDGNLVGNFSNLSISGSSVASEGYIANAISAYDTSLNQTAVFNKLTNNGASQGIYMSNGQLYINGTYVKAKTITSEKLSDAVNNSISAAQTTANGANSQEQLIYISKASGTTSVTAPTSWVTNTTGDQNTWTIKRPEYNSSYPVLFVATQRQTVSGTVSCTTPQIDQTTTVIDGGHITTGTIDAGVVSVTNLNASNINTGTLSANYIKGGTLTLGGNNNINGQLQIQNGSGTVIGTWNKDGLKASGELEISTSGYSTGGTIVTKEGSFTITDKTGFVSTITNSQTLYGLIIQSLNNTYNEKVYMIPASRHAVNSKTRSAIASSGTLAIVSNTDGSTTGYAGMRLESGGFYLTEINNSGDGISFNLTSALMQAKYLTGTQAHVGFNFTFGTTTDFYVSGSKSRIVGTNDYSNRVLYCYETPSPLFGDVGEGEIGEDGVCYIWLDPIFAETIITNQYQVFLQKYGDGECYVSERKAGYFIVIGTPSLKFGWEIKAKQADFDQKRLDIFSDWNAFEDVVDYGSNAANYIQELNEGRLTQ